MKGPIWTPTTVQCGPVIRNKSYTSISAWFVSNSKNVCLFLAKTCRGASIYVATILVQAKIDLKGNVEWETRNNSYVDYVKFCVVNKTEVLFNQYIWVSSLEEYNRCNTVENHCLGEWNINCFLLYHSKWHVKNNTNLKKTVYWFAFLIRGLAC